MHWERGRERMREGKERKEKRKGRVVRQGERGGKGVRKEGKKKVYWSAYNGKYKDVCDFLS